MKYTISHLYQTGEGVWVFQSNEEHTAGVATRAAQLAEKFGMASWGNVLGLLHDKGKESKAFQQHIRKASGYDPNAVVDGNYHHAYVGGVIARHFWGKGADNFLVNPISHTTQDYTILTNSTPYYDKACLRKSISTSTNPLYLLSPSRPTRKTFII